MKNIILIILVIIFFNYLYYRYKHKFWSKQPVSNWYYFHFKDTIISKNIPKTYPLSSDLLLGNVNINNNNGLKEIYNFVDNHYQNSTVASYISFPFFLWSLNFPFLYEPIILSLKKNMKIIGTICSKCLKLNINNNQIITSYVDYLCIDKSFRTQNLAPILISNMAEKGSKYSKTFIFKKEEEPLPFRYITTYNYYCLELKKKKKIFQTDFKYIKKLESESLNKIHQFYTKFCMDTYNLYRIYSINEFRYYFIQNDLNKFSEIFFYEINNTIMGLIAFYPFKLKNDKIYYQIQFVLANNEIILNNLFEFFLSYIPNNTDIIVISNTGNNDYLIKKYNFLKDMPCNIHMYNYHIMSNICPKKVCLHFI